MPHPEPEILDALAYGMIESELRGEVEDHIDRCPACRASLTRRREESARLGAVLARPRVTRWLLPAVAAALLVAVGLSFLIPDGPESLQLADGSRVVADGDLRIEGDREVLCGPGEFRFDVASGAVPFRVRTPGADIEVKGTRFDVRVREERVKGRTVLVTFVAVATGSVVVANFFGWLDLKAGQSGSVSEHRAPAVGPEITGRVARLQREVAAERERGRKLEAILDGASAPVRTPDETPPEPAAGEPGAKDPDPAEPDGIPADILKAGKDLGVSEAALRAAMAADAELSPPSKGAGPALAELKTYGEEGFRAVIALLRGGRNGTWFPPIIEATWTPGLEKHLLATVQDETVHKWSRWTALDSLGRTDTPEVRDYLVARLEREKDAGLYMCTALALGQLRESRGARFVDDRIMGPNWSGVRGYILRATGDMGGPDARAFLLRYVRTPKADMLSSAIRSLDKIDGASAEREAAALLASPRGEFIDGPTRTYLEKIAERGR